MKNSTRITLIAIIIILMLLVVGSTIFLYVQKYAYADTEIYNNDSFVTFNQLLRFTSATSYVSRVDNNVGLLFSSGFNSQFPATFSFNAIGGHKYYLFNDNNNGDFRLYMSGGITQQFNTIYAPTSDITITQLFVVNVSSVELNKNIHFNIIDLSLMYGLGNEPDIDKCREIFTALWYPYNTGSPISLNGLNSYAQGVWDTIGAQKVQYNNNIISNLAFAYNTGTITSQFDYESNLGVYQVVGVMGVPVGSIPNDSQITTYTTFWLPNYTGGYYYMTMYKQDGNLQVADISPIIAATNENYVRASFTIPITTDTLYFALSTNGSSIDPNATMYVFNTDLEFTTTDIQAITYSAYERGAEYYRTYYSDGNEGYLEIFNAGKQYAITHNTNNAWGSAWDFIESAFTGIGSIFAIELLPNVPLSVFILVPLMISLIFFVVKLVKGGD